MARHGACVRQLAAAADTSHGRRDKRDAVPSRSAAPPPIPRAPAPRHVYRVPGPWRGHFAEEKITFGPWVAGWGPRGALAGSRATHASAAARGRGPRPEGSRIDRGSARGMSNLQTVYGPDGRGRLNGPMATGGTLPTDPRTHYFMLFCHVNTPRRVYSIKFEQHAPPLMLRRKTTMVAK